MLAYLYCSKYGLSIHLIITRVVLVKKDLLWMGISAQELAFIMRHFPHPHKPLHYCGLRLSWIWVQMLHKPTQVTVWLKYTHLE